MALPNIQVITRKDSLINPINFELPYKSLLYLNERHDKAQEQLGKLNSYKGQLLSSVHESERDKVSARYDSYMSQIDNFVDPSSGYAGNALSAALRLGQEAAGDYYFIGRQVANKAYEDYRTGIINSKLSESQKRYLLENAKYSYTDKYENETDDEAKSNKVKEELSGIIHDPSNLNDKVTGGTTWTPSTFAVEEKDLQKFMAGVASTVGKTYGGANSTVYYRDANGNYTPDASKSIDGLWYYQKTNGGFEKLDKNKLIDAIYNAFASDKGHEDWLRRQYDIGVWENNNGKSDFISEFTDRQGNVLSYDDYKKQIITRFATDNAYYKPGGTTYTSEPGMKLLATLAKPTTSSSSKSGGGDTSETITSLNKYSNPSGNISVKIKTANDKIGEKLLIEQNLSILAEEMNLPLTGQESAQEIYSSISKKYNESNTPVPAEIIQAYKNWKKLNEELESEFANNKDLKDNLEFKAAMDKGSDLSFIAKTNPIAERYLKRVNETFRDFDNNQVDNIYFPVKDADRFLDEFSTNVSYAKNLGLHKYVDKLGQQYISLDKEHSQYLYFVNKAIANSIGRSTGMYIDESTGEQKFRPSGGYPIQGTFIKLSNGNMVPQRNNNWTNSFVNNIDDEYERATKYLIDNHLINSNGETEDNYASVPLYTISENNLMELNERLSGSKDYVIKHASEISNDALQAMTGNDIPEIQLGNNKSNTTYPVTDPETKSIIISAIQALATNPTENHRVDFHTQKLGYGTLITVAPKIDWDKKQHHSNVRLGEIGGHQVTTDEGFRVFLPEWQLSEIKDYLESLPGYKESRKLSLDYLSKHETPLFDCTYRLTSANGNDFIMYRKGSDQGSPMDLSTAGKFLRLSNIIDDYNSIIISRGGIDNKSQQYRSMISNIIVNLGDCYGLTVDDLTTDNKPDKTKWPIQMQHQFDQLVYLLTKDIE